MAAGSKNKVRSLITGRLLSETQLEHSGSMPRKSSPLHANATTSPAARLSLITAVVASLLFVTFLVVSTSRAAFSDTTENTNSTVSTGDVVLTDDDAGSALFTAAGLAPTQSLTECIEVSYDGSIIPTVPVRLYSSAAPTGTGLETYLDLTIEEGTGGTYGSCAGFAPASTIYSAATLDAFTTSRLAWATGLDTTWTPGATGETRTFRFTLVLQDNNAAQGLDSGFGFTWEAQS